MSGDVEPRRAALLDNQLRQKKSNQILKKEIQMDETITSTPTPTSTTTSTLEKRMKRNVIAQGSIIPCVMMAVLMDNLMWSHNDKKDATHDDGTYCSNRYYKFTRRFRSS